MFICNKCETTNIHNTRTDSFKISYQIGYGTIYDGDRIEASLCDTCLIDMFSNFLPSAIIKGD